MNKKKSRKGNIDLGTVRAVRDRLVTFVEEFDSSEPEETEVKLDTHLSSLLEEGIIKTKKKGKDLYLDEVLTNILNKTEDDDLIENARLFRVLISSYGGEPSDDDMDEAYDILVKIVEALSGIEGIDEPYGQAKIKFD
jgi:hypothetical protein